MWKFFNKKDPWYRNAVIYQIYPWSFKDSNGDGIGDLEGIIEKLDYLNDGTPKSLGVEAIWISPIFPSPMKDFGYDISDYKNIDPRFGDLETFDRLVKEAHKRGIKIILDLVTNHTSSEHPWFKESRSSKDNPKRDWYVWHDPKPDRSEPNNWLAVSGGPAWTLDEATGQYYLHNFLSSQPDLNWRNEEVKNEMKSVIQFWLKRGVNGFRVDAMSHFIEDSELRDDPINPLYTPGDNPYRKLIHTYSDNRPETANIINFLCEATANYKDTLIVTESYLSLPELIKIYNSVPYPNHSPFNFNFLGMTWSAEQYRTFADWFDSLVGPLRTPTYVLGNHDNGRLMSRIGHQRTRISAMMLLTLRGMPFIYYGDEIGMKDGVIPPSMFRDGFATSSPAPAASRDPERTPMQWTSQEGSGFSTGTPWLPVSDNFGSVNVEHESADPASLLNLYREILLLRRTMPSLHSGDYISFPTTSRDIFFYCRQKDGEKCFVVLNFSDKTVTQHHDVEKVKILCSTYMDSERNFPSDKEIVLRPFEGIIFTVINESER
jgi:alpha-glucosidase